MTEGVSPLPTRVARALLIVPAAHYKLLDEEFQAEMYELFHTRAGCRIGHMLCTPVVMVGVSLALGSAVASGWSWSLPAALAVVITAWGLRVDRLAGALMIPLLALTILAARALAVSTAHPMDWSAALAVGGAVLQTVSHGFEDLPPPVSGRVGWVPMRAWCSSVSPLRVLGLAALSLAMFTWLELWASLRVWPLQVLHLLMRAGYRPELRARLTARVEEILSTPEREWRVPRGELRPRGEGDSALAVG